ncbi:MAG TPA: DUF2461 domain-containing protein [Anaerolineales bacterium]|jgi:uncharacterized protein (TIGR02453 family)
MDSKLDMQPVLKFLQGLNRNNNRDWFQAHRDEYETARDQFEQYVAALISALSRTESLSGVTPKDCIFRLNRDLRFTKDKTPYKPYMSAYIAPGGRKSRQMGYYVHIQPGNHSMIAGGLHEPEPQQIVAWRRSIDRDARPFKRITSDKTFHKYFGAVGGESLKTAPKGYPKDHPELDLLRLKSITVTRTIPDALITSPRLVDETLKTSKAMKPLLKYLGSLG